MHVSRDYGFELIFSSKINITASEYCRQRKAVCRLKSVVCFFKSIFCCKNRFCECDTFKYFAMSCCVLANFFNSLYTVSFWAVAHSTILERANLCNSPTKCWIILCRWLSLIGIRTTWFEVSRSQITQCLRHVVVIYVSFMKPVVTSTSDEYCF